MTLETPVIGTATRRCFVMVGWITYIFSLGTPVLFAHIWPLGLSFG